MRLTKITIVLLCSILLWCSCEDFLTQEPRHAKTQEDMWKTPQDITASVGALYYLVRDAFEGNAVGYGWGDYFLFGDVASGDWISPAGDGDWTRISKGQFRALGEQTFSWKRFYRTIEQANLILENASKVTSANADFIEEAKGHALFARGYTYLTLTRIFKDVPLNLRSQNIDPLARSPRMQVLLQIEKDLLAAKAILPAKYMDERGQYDKNKSHCMGTKGACDAILARVYMWMAYAVEKGETTNAAAGENVKTAEAYYDLAIKAVNDVEQSGEYQLLAATDYRDIFDKGYTRESIFEIYYSDDEYPRRGDWAGEGDGTNYYGSAMTWWLVHPYTSRMGIVNITMKMERYQELFPTAVDKRATEFFVGLLDYQQPTGYQFVSPLTLNPETQQENLIFAKYRKRFDSSYDFPNNPIVSRLGWLILFRAEAHFKKGDKDAAIADINRVRNRAGLTSLPTSLSAKNTFDELRDEFRREAIGESVVYYFLLRNEIVSTMNPGISSLDEQQGRTYWPISEDAFRNNQNMTQNKGW
ncbi:RagB/SusD family nutrient uptake outer membrane protein [Puteibacter caeruleilacunae]|nr:RagB/SusD family nutrient uptake outer membrane protein [Puteibacter caeruleilacunae]